MSVLYPVATNAEAALSAPLGRAARERDAEHLAGAAVEFRVEEAGPAFVSRDQALDAFAGRVEDDRPGRAATPAAEDRFLTLRQVVARQGGRLPIATPARPVNQGGRRWPDPPADPLPTVWRVSVSYWRPKGETEIPGQAREVRRAGRGSALGRKVLNEPQQPLDIGLFEAPLPESPGRFIPDE